MTGMNRAYDLETMRHLITMDQISSSIDARHWYLIVPDADRKLVLTVVGEVFENFRGMHLRPETVDRLHLRTVACAKGVLRARGSNDSFSSVD